MRTTARIVIDADPEVKCMVEESNGQSVKQIIENLICEANNQF